MTDHTPNFRALARRLFPNGTNAGVRELRIPEWPPDLFAFAATAAEHHGIYAEMPFTAGWIGDGYRFKEDYIEDVKRLCNVWFQNAAPPTKIVQAWNRLLRLGKRPGLYDWRGDVMLLLVVADAVCEVVGFDLDNEAPQLYARAVFSELLHLQKGEARDLPLSLPSSLCWMVPPTEACVQPKTNTPKVGCTLRSMTHYLALLPPIGVVNTSWIYAAPASSPSANLNVLLIPFPYRIDASDFTATAHCVDRDNLFFGVRQGWLSKDGGRASADDIKQLLLALIDAAQREAETVHALVLPELALDGTQVDEVARLLAGAKPRLELFVTGVLDRFDNDRFQNSAYTACLLGGEVVQSWRQPKHHRWRLEAGQIKRYNLGFALDPERIWWEQIDVSSRSCAFTVVRPGASFATLVCEDLARSDPVMPVINAVGPNLLVALLMDGPQWERRWPGRYATVLADDPGTSVLTLTSIGMIDRSANPGQAPPRQIALWKQASEEAKELTLPAGDHALLLSLTMAPDTQLTLDRRSDGGEGCQFKLSGVRGIRLLKDKFPAWIGI